MPIQLRHQTQQTQLPSAASHGVGLPVYDGGASGIARGLSQVAGAAGQIGARLQQRKEEKENEMYSLKAERMRLARVKDYQGALSALSEAEMGNDPAAIKAAQNEVAKLADFEHKEFVDWNAAYGDPDSPVPEKYLQPKQSRIYEKYQEFYHRREAQKIGQETQKEFDSVRSQVISEPTANFVRDGGNPEEYATSILEGTELLQSHGAVQNSNERIAAARQGLLMEAAKPAVDALLTQAKTLTSEEDIQTHLAQAERLLDETNYGSTEDENKWKIGAKDQINTLRERLLNTDDGFKDRLDLFQSEQSALEQKGLSGTSEEFDLLQHRLELMNIPKNSKYYESSESTKTYLGFRSELSNPKKVKEYFDMLDKGEQPVFNGVNSTQNDRLYTVLRQRAQAYADAKVSGNIPGQIAAINPHFARSYQMHADRFVSADLDGEDRENLFLYGMGLIEFHGEVLGLDPDEIKREATPYFEEMSRTLLDPEQSLDRAFASWKNYHDLLRKHKYQPGAVAAKYAEYGNIGDPEDESLRDAAAFLTVVTADRLNPQSAIVQALVQSGKKITTEQGKLISAAEKHFADEDVTDFGAQLVRSYLQSDRNMAYAVSRTREALMELYSGQGEDPIKVAQYTNAALKNAFSIQKGLGGDRPSINVDGIPNNHGVWWEELIYDAKLNQRQVNAMEKEVWETWLSDKIEGGLDTFLGHAIDEHGSKNTDIPKLGFGTQVMMALSSRSLAPFTINYHNKFQNRPDNFRDAIRQYFSSEDEFAAQVTAENIQIKPNSYDDTKTGEPIQVMEIRMRNSAGIMVNVFGSAATIPLHEWNEMMSAAAAKQFKKDNPIGLIQQLSPLSPANREFIKGFVIPGSE